MSGRRDNYLQAQSRNLARSGSLPPWRSLLTSLSGVLRRNQDLLRNASTLAATTGVTSTLGFAYWIYAARIFPAQAVGYGSASISTMTLLGTVGMFGIGTMLIGELPRGGNRGGLMMASIITAFIGSLTLGLGFAVISAAYSGHFSEINGTFSRIVIFSFGVAITGATLTLDDATIGLMRGGLQLSRNITVSIAKMVALPAAGLVLHDLFGVGIMLAWVIGTVISLIPVVVTIKRGGGRVLHRPDWAAFWQLGRVTLAHTWLNFAITTPSKLIPVLVAIVVAPSSNGAYYIATMISSFLFMVPQHLSTVLFAIASAAPEKIAAKLRFVLRTSLAIGIPAGLILALSAHFILSVFGSKYAALATGPLCLLLVGYIPGLPNSMYIAIARATGRVNQAAIFLTVFAVLRMGALVIGGKLGGLYGLSYGMLAVSTVQSLITTPSVLRVAFGNVAVETPADTVSANQVRHRPMELAEETRQRQDAGLAALISLATTAAPSLPFPVIGDLRATNAAGAGTAIRPARTEPVRPPVIGQGRHRRAANIPVMNNNQATRTTDWWPDIDEASFRSRQESGVAALIAIATHAARF